MFKRLGILAILVVMALMVSVPAVAAQGRALANGNIWIEDDIRINFNARADVFLDEGVDGFPFAHFAASGHLFWREDGQINRVSVDRLAFQWWPDCTLISGIVYDGPRAVVEEGQYPLRLCLVVCEDYVMGQWNGDFFGGDIIHGNFFIKE